MYRLPGRDGVKKNSSAPRTFREMGLRGGTVEGGEV
jgi:hypothetical protein